MRSIRWTYLNFNVYRLSCPFHNNELSPVNEGRIKSGTFFKHMLNSSALMFLGIDLILILGITRSMEISAVFHSTDSLLAQSQVNVCHWAAQGDFERSIMTSLHSHMFRSIAHLWGKSVDHWWILFATGDGMWAPWCSICITGPFWEEYQSISPQSLINLHFTFAYPYFICVGAMHIGPI